MIVTDTHWLLLTLLQVHLILLLKVNSSLHFQTRVCGITFHAFKILRYLQLQNIEVNLSSHVCIPTPMSFPLTLIPEFLCGKTCPLVTQFKVSC